MKKRDAHLGRRGGDVRGVRYQRFLSEMTQAAGRGLLLSCLEAFGIWNKTGGYTNDALPHPALHRSVLCQWYKRRSQVFVYREERL